MPSLTLPQPPHFIQAPPTKEDLDYADLRVIDFSKIGTAEGRAELAEVVKDALLTHGFFYVINHGYTQDQSDRMFDIANIPSNVPEDEKQVYASNFRESGSFMGYKLRSHWKFDAGVIDQIEHYNVNRHVNTREHPQALRPFLSDIESFCRLNHVNLLLPLLRLMAISLELPEETFVDIHGYDGTGASYVRLMKYYPRSEEDEIKTQNIWLNGHTDVGTVSLLWSQPVAALQILSRDGQWRYVKHVENAIIVNTGDCLDFLTGGFYKGTIHRVRQPPPDQQAYERLSVIYFSLPDDETKLAPVTGSRVLQEARSTPITEDDAAPVTVEEYRKSRTKSYGNGPLKKGKEENVEEEVVVHGIVVKYYK